MVSLAQGNTLRKSAFCSKIFVKDFVCGGRVVDYFWPPAIFLLKISSKDLPVVCFVVTQHSESELSLCLRYSKTSCL